MFFHSLGPLEDDGGNQPLSLDVRIGGFNQILENTILYKKNFVKLNFILVNHCFVAVQVLGGQ